jgi:hypothetical protein
MHRKEEVVWHVAQDFYEPFHLAEFQDVTIQRILRVPKAFYKAVLAGEDPKFDAFNGFPCLVGAGSAPFRVFF